MRNWSFASVWNDSLSRAQDRPIEVRERIFASEMGGSMIDRYLKMTGVKPTNPPNNRALRKFQAGNIWEYIVSLVLRRSGILYDHQQRIEFKVDNLLPVSGRLDFLAGGIPDFERAQREVADMHLPEMLNVAAMDIIESLKHDWDGREFKKKVLEIKSSSDIMFNKYMVSGADARHRLQAFHYLKGLDMEDGAIVYINKDNCMIQEFPVYNPSNIEDLYVKDIQEITYYVRNNERPGPEPEVIIDSSTSKFSMNFKVEYSPYLSMIYGYPDSEAYRAKYQKLVAGINRVLSRVVEGKKMTEKNKEIIEEAKKICNWDEVVDIAIENAKNGNFTPEEEEE